MKKTPSPKRPKLTQREVRRRYHQHMVRVFGAGVAMVMIAAIAVVVSQPTSAADDGETWRQPITITINGQQFTDYHQLHGTGDVVYYQLAITEPTKVRLAVSLSESAATRFAPQVVVYEPSDVTASPNIPIEQPSNTIGLVYPMTEPRTRYDLWTQTQTVVRLEAEPELQQVGTYTIAVYNAGSADGEIQFALDRYASTMQWQDVLRFPMHWWREQLFAGFTWRTLIAPLIFGLLAWLVYLRLDHHQLHVHKTYTKAQSSSRRP